MNKKAPFDFDAAMAALKIDERTARPAISEGLLARVLGDAAEVARAAAPPAPMPMAGSPERSGGFRLFGLFDAWSGAAVAALALCLVIGLGIGYGAGPELMAQTVLGDVEIALAAEENDGLFPSEDVL
jgi:hypothetical protein